MKIMTCKSTLIIKSGANINMAKKDNALWSLCLIAATTKPFSLPWNKPPSFKAPPASKKTSEAKNSPKQKKTPSNPAPMVPTPSTPSSSAWTTSPPPPFSTQTSSAPSPRMTDFQICQCITIEVILPTILSTKKI